MGENTGLSRRAFLKTAAIAGAGIAGASLLQGCSTKGSASEKWDKEADVVIVGAGAAGMAAAIEAAGAGVKVIVLEKMSAAGGDTRLSMGELAGYQTKIAKKLGIDVTEEEAIAAFQNPPSDPGDPDPEVSLIIARECGRTIDWLIDLGVEFLDVVGGMPDYGSVQVFHYGAKGGQSIAEGLEAALKKTSAELIVNTRATSLVTGENGRVVGVVAEGADGTIRVKAAKAVVLTTGGFASNAKMTSALLPTTAGLTSISSPGSTGDGLGMANALGAILMRGSAAPLAFPANTVDGSGMLFFNVFNAGGMAVGEDAKRFLAEDTPFMYIKNHVLLFKKLAKQKEKHYFLIANDGADVQTAVATYPKAFTKADTLDELASTLGLDATVLKQTVGKYNADCAAGVDSEFGRKGFLKPLAAPYYGAKVRPQMFHTPAGLKQDTDTRVLRWASVGGDKITEPIPGLFAAGEVCEWQNPPGWTLCGCITLGRVAGKKAAAETAAA